MTTLDTRYTLGDKELTLEEARLLLRVLSYWREHRLAAYLKVEVTRNGELPPRITRQTSDTL